jgi:hypothetical protein
MTLQIDEDRKTAQNQYLVGIFNLRRYNARVRARSSPSSKGLVIYLACFPLALGIVALAIGVYQLVKTIKGV